MHNEDEILFSPKNQSECIIPLCSTQSYKPQKDEKFVLPCIIFIRRLEELKTFLVPEGIICPVVSVSALICYNRYIYY